MLASLREKYKDSIDFIDVAHNDPESQELIEQFNVNKYPTTVFIDQSGKIIETMTAFKEDSNSLLELNISKLLTQ